MRAHKVLSNRPRLTQSAYREAVSETVRALQDGMSDQDMATAWGVSSGTVLNARNRNHDIGAVPLLQLADRFGLEALDTVLSLVVARAVPAGAAAFDVAGVPCDVARTLPLLIELFADGTCSDEDVAKLDAAGAIDLFARVSDMLRERRDARRLRGVS